MRYKYIFFDLDGTLTDPGLGITNAIMYARKKRGLDPGRNEDYYRFIGPPMPQSFVEYWGVSMDEAKAILADYREYYVPKGIFENRVYPGIPQALESLKAAGCKLYVATSKPTFMSEQIVERFGLAPYFETVSGSDPDRPDSTKADVICAARDAFGIDMGRAVMVGDRSFDVIGARECSIPCVGVAFGYGSREELTDAGAVYVADTAEELAAWLLG